MDYFGVSSLEDLFNDRDKLKEYLNFQKPDGRLIEPDGGFEIVVDDLKKIKPEVFDPNYEPKTVEVDQEQPQTDTEVKQESKTPSFKSFFSEACWKNYKQVGMKKKNGKEVPNCVSNKNKKK